jgi:hypothetical protein
MLPSELKAEQFQGYPPEARTLAVQYVGLFQQLPPAFLPSLLRELIEYDFKFPAERLALQKELSNLSSLSAEQRAAWFAAFAQIQLSPALQQLDWVNAPAQFVEQLSAHLWSTHQLDAFRTAATDYANRLRAAVPPQNPALPRLGVTVIGQGVAASELPLFRKLRPQGTYYTNVSPENGLRILLDGVAARARLHREPYAHWYIDGGQEAPHDPALTLVSYGALQDARANLSRKLREQIERPGMGPEALRSLLARMQPADLGLDKSGDPVLQRFQVKLLTEGSGTQIFSTTFAQWAARETLRRAQPVTLLVRFSPRQRQRPMNELLYGKQEHTELDPAGSLVDADFAAYYNWLNQQRLPGASQSSFLVWFEDHREALLIGPSAPRGAISTAPVDLQHLLEPAG